MYLAKPRALNLRGFAAKKPSSTQKNSTAVLAFNRNGMYEVGGVTQ